MDPHSPSRLIRKKPIFLLLILVASFFMSIIPAGNASAADVESLIGQQTLNVMIKCAKMKDSIQLDKFGDATDIIERRDDGGKYYIKDDQDFDCDEIYDYIEERITEKEIFYTYDESNKKRFLEKNGYEAPSDSNPIKEYEYDVAIYVVDNFVRPYTSQQITVEDGGWEFGVEFSPTNNDDIENIRIDFSASNEKLCFFGTGGMMDYAERCFQNNGGTIIIPSSFSSGNEQILSRILDPKEMTQYENSIIVTAELLGIGDSGLVESNIYKYIGGENTLTLDGKKIEITNFDKKDIYTMYMYYFNNSYEAYISKDADEKKICYGEPSPQGSYLYDIKTGKYCMTTAPRNVSLQVPVFDLDKNNIQVFSKTVGFLELLNEINEIAPQVRSDSTDDKGNLTDDSLPAAGVFDKDKDNTTVITDPGDACYQNAGSISWFICPISSLVSEALFSMYEDVEKDFLIVDTQTEMGDTTKGAWDKFMSIANIALIICLLVIIFSQVTGYGIDNYSIKKILPKFIVTAILINLSFLACQIAIEISNILGSSLRTLFSGIDVTFKNNSVLANVDTNNWFRAILDIGTLGVAAGGIFSVAGNIFNNGAINGLVIPAVLLLIVALIAVIFFFIILGVRKAAVIILTIISPLAIVCYMLPNTKKYFTKWLNAMKGVLLIYPICGVLVGGGEFASKIILVNATDYIMYFVGSLLMVVPFFFVPSILKSSLSAIGNIGQKISGFGKNLGSKTRSRTENAIKNSNGYKARQADFGQRNKFRQEEAEFNRNQRRRNALLNRQARLKENGEDLSDAEKNRLYQYTNSSNQFIQNQANAAEGATVLSKDVAATRAHATRIATESRNLQDQYSTMGQDELLRELDSAMDSYEGDRSEYNAIRLREVLAAADKKRMSDKYVLDKLNKKEGFKLGTSDNDNIVLEGLTTNNSFPLSKYAKNALKQKAKGEEGVAPKSFHEYINGDDEFSFKYDVNTNGVKSLVGQNDDFMKFVSGNAVPAVTANHMLEGALATNNDKELIQYNNILRSQIKSAETPLDISIKTSNFSNMQLSTFEILKTGVENGKVSSEAFNNAIHTWFDNNNAAIRANTSDKVAKGIQEYVESAGYKTFLDTQKAKSQSEQTTQPTNENPTIINYPEDE